MVPVSKNENQANREIKSAEKAYYKTVFNSCVKDQRKTWKTVNELTSRKSNNNVRNEIQYQVQKSKSQVDVAELLNNFFTEIGPNLSRNVENVEITYEEFPCATGKEFVFEETTSAHIFLCSQNFVSLRLQD